MKHRWNRALSLILTGAMLLQAAPWAYAVEAVAEPPLVEEAAAPEEELPVQLLAETLTTGDGYLYTVGTDAVTITGYSGEADVLEIPAVIGGLPVTAIGRNAFSACASVTKVVIPEGVTTLGSRAFGDIQNPLTVHIPKSLTTHSDSVGPFVGSVLEAVTFADGITTIAPYLFSESTLPGTLTLPEIVQVRHGGTIQVPISVKNVEDPVVTATSGLDALVGVSVHMGEDGSGFLTVSGKLPGTATVTVRVGDTNLTASVAVQVVRELQGPALLEPQWVPAAGTATVHVLCGQEAIAAVAVYSTDGQFLGIATQRVVGDQQVDFVDLPQGARCALFLLTGDYAPLCPSVPAK